jgi:hypothetical protein
MMTMTMMGNRTDAQVALGVEELLHLAGPVAHHANVHRHEVLL